MENLPFVLLGSPSAVPDIVYATRFNETDPVAVVRYPEGRTVLLINNFRYGGACRSTAGCEVACPASLGIAEKGGLDALLVQALRKDGVTAIQVDAGFPFGSAEALRAAGIGVRLAAESPWTKARVCKTAEEVAAIRRTQSVAKAAEAYIGSIIEKADVREEGILWHEGEMLTGERARALVRSFLLNHGTMDFEGTLCAPGPQAADPHAVGSGPYHTGEWVVCDIFPRDLETGYWGDCTRTFMNGTPTPELRRLYDAVAEAQRRALAAVRPGVPASTVHHAVEACFLEYGYESGCNEKALAYGFTHATGHGVGLEIHEAPRVSVNADLLQPGMVITIEPGLYYPELGGVRIEDTILVTETGYEIL